MPSVRSKAVAAVLAAVILAVLATLVHGPWKGTRLATGPDGDTQRVASTAMAPPVLAPVSGDPAGATPTDAGIQAVLGPLMKATALGAPPRWPSSTR